MTFWYIATPYAKYQSGVDSAFEMACKQAALLMKAGVPVFSPIAHSHPVAVHGRIETRDHDFWMEVDRPFMECAIGVIMVTADGWHASRGMRQEYEYFVKANKPIVYMEEGRFPPALKNDHGYSGVRA